MEIGVSGAQLSASRAKSLLNKGRTEQISRYIVGNGSQVSYCQRREWRNGVGLESGVFI